MTASSGRRLLAAFTLIIITVAAGQDLPGPRLDPTTVSASRNFSRPAEQVLSAPLLPPGNPPVHGGPISAQIVPAAGIIFSGHVTSVWRAPTPGGITPASTQITFHVDQGMRGTSSGELLTIHEWAGLWDRGERYLVGEGVFLFLYTPSKLGLTSPVAGASGRFAVDSQNRIVMSAQNMATFAADPVIGGKTVVPFPDFQRAILRNAVRR